jgi:methionyl-tRNA formyltransferase
VNPASVRVVFMGSPSFAVPSLRALYTAGYNVVAVVTQPDRPAGRGGQPQTQPVKGAAEQLGVPVLQPEEVRSDESLSAIGAYVPDVLVVAAYGKILPQRLLDLPTRGPVNIHASLLPRWRGASPIASAILAGDQVSGVTVMEMVRAMDAGPIIARHEVQIDPGDTTRTLEPRLAEAGAALLVQSLPDWIERRKAATPQDESRVTTCRLLTKNDGWLEGDMTAAEAERAVRAYDPWPGAFVEYRGQRLGIWKSRVAPPVSGLAVGATVLVGRQPAVVLARGVLVLEEVQRAGARRVSGEAFVNGERGGMANSVALR